MNYFIIFDKVTYYVSCKLFSYEFKTGKAVKLWSFCVSKSQMTVGMFIILKNRYPSVFGEF